MIAAIFDKNQKVIVVSTLIDNKTYSDSPLGQGVKKFATPQSNALSAGHPLQWEGTLSVSWAHM